MCLSGAEEHIPGCSFLERSWMEGRGLKGWKRQERTFGYSCPFFVCWFPVESDQKKATRGLLVTVISSLLHLTKQGNH